MDMPLPMHKLAFSGSEASDCSKEQGKFWEYHQGIMSDQKKLNDLNSFAESIHLNLAKFEACMKTNKYAGEIRKDMDVAQKLGITATPSFVLARTDPKNPAKVKGITLIRGAQPFSAFKKTIDQALSDVKD